ncbi:hypothetical protein BZG36_04167, partial [Bifiguratus adelaidae]
MEQRRPAAPSSAELDREWQQHRKYGIIIDAGSSGSRVQVYSWKDHKYVQDTHLLRDIKGKLPTVERGDRLGLKWTTKIEPGISSLANQPEGVDEHLKPLLDFAMEVVPEDQHSETPIFLMATAGM